MNRIRHEIWTFSKAQLSAQVATLADFAMSLFLAEVCSLWYVWASFLGALSGGIVNCAANYHWVFDTAGLKKKYVILKYFLVWTGSILLNTGGTYVLTEVSKQYFIFAKVVVAICVGVLWNYQLQRNFVYRDIHIQEKIQKRRHYNNNKH